jgi:hypothetical protein
VARQRLESDLQGVGAMAGALRDPEPCLSTGDGRFTEEVCVCEIKYTLKIKYGMKRRAKVGTCKLNNFQNFLSVFVVLQYLSTRDYFNSLSENLFPNCSILSK